MLYSLPQKFPQCCLWNKFQCLSEKCWPSLIFSQEHPVLPSMSLPSRWLMVWLQSFRSSETRATLWWLLCRQSICSVISLHSDMSMAVYPWVHSCTLIPQRKEAATEEERSGMPMRWGCCYSWGHCWMGCWSTRGGGSLLSGWDGI